MGFVYAGGIWGGHAWIEVLIGHDWIPVDGALYSPGPADAARFSCYTSSVETNSLGSIGGLAQLFSNVDISVQEYSVSGKRTVVPEHAKACIVSGNSYRNPWLKLSLSKPAGYRFTGFNLVWPQATLVSMEEAGHCRIEVEDLSASLPTSPGDVSGLQEYGVRGKPVSILIGGRKCLLFDSPKKAAVLIRRKGSCWLVVGSGPGARREAMKVVSTISIGS
jgi:hypothetical protein